MIRLDTTNLMAAAVGAEHGLRPAAIARRRKAGRAAVESFRKKSESGEYGFPHLPFQEQVIRQVRAYAAGCRGRFDAICLVGIGGSALGAWALECALRRDAKPRLVILDNVDPALIGAALEAMNPRRTLVVVITKSGSTAETIATYLVVRRWMGKHLAGRVVAITDPEKGDLLEIARRERCPTFDVPRNVGGRFSVLSPVGLLPAALIGIDIRKLCAGARDITKAAWKTDARENPALEAALVHYLLGKPIQVVFSYSSLLWGLAFWFRQLWAESIGKQGRGQTPVAALGVTDQHSQVQLYLEGPNDKVFTLWAVGAHRALRIPKAFADLDSCGYLGGQSLGTLFDAERRATTAALTRYQRPNCTVTVERVDAWHLGALLQMMEFQTAFMGELMGINAFDQPGVELGKRITYALMGRKGFEEYLL